MTDKRYRYLNRLDTFRFDLLTAQLRNFFLDGESFLFDHAPIFSSVVRMAMDSRG